MRNSWNGLIAFNYAPNKHSLGANSSPMWEILRNMSEYVSKVESLDFISTVKHQYKPTVFVHIKGIREKKICSMILTLEKNYARNTKPCQKLY